MKITRTQKFSLAALWTVLVVLLLGSMPSGAGASSNGLLHSVITKDWTVTIWVARTSVKAGTSIPATVTVNNRSGHRINIEGCPGVNYEMVAGSVKVPNSPVIPSVACSSTMSPGIHVFHTKVQTIYMVCGGGGNPSCGQPPRFSPLPAGTYRTQIVLPNARPALPTPHALTIFLTGATGLKSSVAITGRRAAHVHSCLETKVFTNGLTGLHFPSCWTLHNYVEESMMSNVMAFLSNQPTHPPCVTTGAATKTTVRCGYPIKSLRNGGVLVIFINGGMPGWTIANQTGKRLVVDHHVTRETVTPHPRGSLHATEEISIFISANVPDNYYELTAFFRNPGVAEDQRLLEKMLNSMRFG
jgi:hypothetical protein